MVLLACALVGAVTFVVVGAPVAPRGLACCSGCVGIACPISNVHVPRKKRLASSRSSFPQAVDLMAASLRAGHAFTTLLMVAEEIAGAARCGVQAAVRPAELRHAACRDVLKGFAERVPILDARILRDGRADAA